MEKMIEKKKVTNEEYTKVLQNEADLYWKKVFAYADNNATKTPEEIEKLNNVKSQYWREMDEALVCYEIIPFEVEHENPEIVKLVNRLCNSEEQKNPDCKLFRGSIHNIGMTKDSCDLFYLLQGIGGFDQAGFESHCSQVFKSNNNKITVGYCEGDITITVHNTEIDYWREVGEVVNFYGKN
jgi:hypothetical protein